MPDRPDVRAILFDLEGLELAEDEEGFDAVPRMTREGLPLPPGPRRLSELIVLSRINRGSSAEVISCKDDKVVKSRRLRSGSWKRALSAADICFGWRRSW
jgi:hypothetical protein